MYKRQRIEGVGFLEAKKRALNSSLFEAIRKKQLRTIAANAPLAQLLLYDYEPSTIAHEPQSWYDDDYRYVGNSRAVCTPLAAAASAGVKRRDQLYSSVSLSYQLLNRYMRGFDLHHRPDVIQAVKGFVAAKRLPKYLLSVVVRYGEPMPDVSELNGNVWLPDL